MLTVDHYARIRQLHRDGLTIRQIADQLHHSPKTILKALANPEPQPLRVSAPRAAPVFGPFRPFVDEILAADATADVAASITPLIAFEMIDLVEAATSFGAFANSRHRSVIAMVRMEAVVHVTVEVR